MTTIQEWMLNIGHKNIAIVIDGDGYIPRMGTHVKRISRFHAFPRPFTLFRELSRQLPTNSLANHQTAHPSPTPPDSPFHASLKVRAMLRRFTHANIPSRRRSTRLSRARLYYRGGCKSRVDGMPSWLRSRRGTAMKFERNIKSHRIYSLLHYWAWSDTCVLVRRSKHGKHGLLPLATDIIYLI